MLKIFIGEDADGKRHTEEAIVVYNYGIDKESELLGSPRHQFTYKSGTREIEKAVITFANSDLVLTSTPVRTVYLAFATGYVPTPEWAHGMYQGELVVEGMSCDVSTPDARKKVAALNESLSRLELSTGQVCYSMHENACFGLYHPYGFSTPDAVAP